MVRIVIVSLFCSILAGMLAVTTYASLDRSILNVGSQLTSDRWFHATLADAYFGFLTFYVWVAYKESRWWCRVVWLVLIMTLGNIAMSIYVLIELWRWDKDRGFEALLLQADSIDGAPRD